VAVGSIVGEPDSIPHDVGDASLYSSANTTALRVNIALDAVRLVLADGSQRCLRS
jgi:hypothetical protein